MPLYLHYIDSVSPHLEEILQPLITKHVDFKLRDSFRIITPDTTTAQDLEAQLLKDPRLGQVLIGKSILSFRQFWQTLWRGHPQYRPMASRNVEAKAFYKVVTEETAKQQKDQLFSWDIHSPTSRNQAWGELKRAHWLESLRRPEQNHWKVHPLWQHTEEFLEHFGWVSEAQALKTLGESTHLSDFPELKGLSEIFCLGWSSPDPQLFRLLKVLLRHSPSLKIYCFLPNPETCLDTEGHLSPLIQAWETLAEETTVHKALSPATVIPHIYPTPWHEAGGLWQLLHSETTQAPLILARDASLQANLLRLFHQNQDKNNTETVSVVTGLKKQLQTLVEASTPKKPISFRDFLQTLLPWLNSQRLHWAKENFLAGLQLLSTTYQSLEAMAQAGTLWDNSNLPSLWLEELFLELSRDTSQTKMLPQYPWLSAWGQTGISYHASRVVGGLHEEALALHYDNPLFHFPNTNLWEHLERLKLRQLTYQSAHLHLSYSQYDMAGRLRGPSPLLAEYLEQLPETPQPEQISLASDTAAWLLAHPQHPFYQENVTREHQRLSELNTDSGDLREIAPQAWLKRFQQRPLSPSYLDDYAKCPWRFFARWQLKVDSRDLENLYAEPKARGQWIHQLLEKTYQPFLETHFTQVRFPSLEELKQTLAQAVSRLSQELQASEEFSWIPKPILEDEIQKAKAQVFSLMEVEHQRWQEQKQALLPHHLEWSFGNRTQPFEITLPKVGPVPLTGFVDRIDYNPQNGAYLVIDYKSSQTSKLSERIRADLSFQLFLYALAAAQKLYPHGEVIGGLYWDLKETKLNQGLAKKEPLKNLAWKGLTGKSFLTEEKYEEKQEILSQSLNHHLNKIVHGDYRLTPVECEGKHCPYHEICRYEPQPK